MATPRQSLIAAGQDPTPAVIAHEVGHTAVAFAQVGHLVRPKADSVFISFSHRHAGEGAHSCNPTKYSTPGEIAKRHLAGAMGQAILLPESLAPGFRNRLLVGTLFPSALCWHTGSESEIEMTQNLAATDWAVLKLVAKSIEAKPAARAIALATLQIELRTWFQEARFHAILRALAADATLWLDTEDPEDNCLKFYPETRIAAVFAHHP